MIKMSMCVILLACSMSTAQAQFAADRTNEQGKQPGPDPATQILRDLQEARELLKRVPASANRDRIELLLTRTELQLKQLGMGIGGLIARPKPISAEDFNRLSVSLRNQAFDKDKYQFLETTASGRYFTCDQASTLLRHFSFDTDRIKGAVTLYPQLTDAENFHRVLEVFTFEGSRKSVMERIKMR